MTSRRYEIVVFRNETPRLTLEALASRAGMHPALVERFVEFGLLEPLEWEGADLLFDPSAVGRLCTIGRLRESLGINLTGISVVLDLLERVRALERENETLRRRL